MPSPTPRKPPAKKPVAKAAVADTAVEEETVPVSEESAEEVVADHPEYYLLVAYMIHCLGATEEMITEHVELAKRTNAPSDTVMWEWGVETVPVSDGTTVTVPHGESYAWITRETLARTNPIFLGVLEDRIK